MAIYNGNPMSSKSVSTLIPHNYHTRVPLTGQTPKHHIAHIGLLNILTYLGEMSLLLVPGVGEAMGVQVGIGLAGATVRLGLAVGNHQVNTISEAIDFSSAFLPGINAGITNVKLAKGAASETTQKFLNEMMLNNRNELEANGLKLEERVQKQMFEYGEKKLRYQARAKLVHNNANKKAMEQHFKEHSRNIKWLEKKLKEAEELVDKRAMKYYKQAIRFTNRFSPLVHPKRLSNVYNDFKGSAWKEFKKFRESQRQFGHDWALTRRRVNIFGVNFEHKTKVQFKQMLTDLEHDWSKGILMPWSRTVEHKGAAFDEFFANLIRHDQLPSRVSPKQVSATLVKKQEISATKFAKRTIENKIKLDMKLGKFKPFKITPGLAQANANHLAKEQAAIWDNTLIENIAKKLAQIKPSFKTDKGFIFKGINSDLDKMSMKNADRIEKYLLISTKQKERQLSYLVYKRLLGSMFKSIKEGSEKDTLRALFRSMGKLSYHRLSKLFDASLNTLSKETSESQAVRLNEAFEAGTGYFYKANAYEKISKKYHFGDSTKFRYHTIGKYGKIGKVRNMINPMTAARAIPDALYQTIKKYLDHKTESTFAKQAGWLSETILTDEEKALRLTGDEVTAEKLLEEDRKAKALFVKNGGILVPENRYLIGFKIIPSPYETEGEKLLLFVFNKIQTMTKNKTSKNRHGKPDILATATEEDILKLTEIGVSYYWAVGKSKGWYTNRGGRQSKSLLDRAVGSSLSLYLGFAPTNEIRQVVTLVSSTEYETIRWVNGSNERNVGNKMFSTGFRTALNRLGRLAARYPIPRISSMFSGTRGLSFDRGVVGKEFQRYMSMSLALTIRTSTTTGKLQVGLPSMKKLMYKLEMTGANSGMRQGFTRHRYKKGFKEIDRPRGGKELKQKENKYYNSRIRQMRGARRRLNYISRAKGIAYSRGFKHGTHIGQIKW